MIYFPTISLEGLLHTYILIMQAFNPDNKFIIPTNCKAKVLGDELPPAYPIIEISRYTMPLFISSVLICVIFH